MPAPPVTVVKATAQDVSKYLDEIGRNAAFESVTVTPQVRGRVVERHFQDGENLKKEQLLFVFDPRPYKAQLDAAQASLAQAKAALKIPAPVLALKRPDAWKAKSTRWTLPWREAPP
jgi:multidrug efflux pump subunit AcrA (membrane-fusion protein)